LAIKASFSLGAGSFDPARWPAPPRHPRWPPRAPARRRAVLLGQFPVQLVDLGFQALDPAFKRLGGRRRTAGASLATIWATYAAKPAGNP